MTGEELFDETLANGTLAADFNWSWETLHASLRDMFEVLAEALTNDINDLPNDVGGEDGLDVLLAMTGREVQLRHGVHGLEQWVATEVARRAS